MAAALTHLLPQFEASESEQWLNEYQLKQTESHHVCDFQIT